MNPFRLYLRNKGKEFLLYFRLMKRSGVMRKPNSPSHLYFSVLDGNCIHGGMCDRFKSIISLYAFCKANNLPFRIKYSSPFQLEKILVPAEYDWGVKAGEYTDNPLFVKILFMRKEPQGKRLMRLKTRRQVHLYSNRNWLEHINNRYNTDFKWGELYKELFKPSPVLQTRIDEMKKNIDGEYIAAVFRFQNLLGDFLEYELTSLPSEAEKTQLIQTCLRGLKDVMSSYPDVKFLVTSDSLKFLNEAVKLDRVYIIPGELKHMDQSRATNSEEDLDPHLKAFTDFYMIGGAKKIYRIGTPQMYPSEFPMYAAKVNDVPFESVIC